MHLKANNSKKILLIHNGRGLGGAPRSMKMIADRMKSEGYKVKILFLYKSEAVDLYHEFDYSIVGIPTRYFGHGARWYKLYELHIILYQVLSWIVTVCFIAPYWLNKTDPDLVYCNSSVLTDWSFVAKLKKIKNIVHVREPISKGHFGFRNLLIKKILNFSADHIIFLSDHNYRAIQTKILKSTIIPNYVKCNKRKLDFNTDYDLIYVGGSQSIKGIELIQKLIEANIDKVICIIGHYDSDFIERYKNKVKFVGMTTKPLDYIGRSRILLYPSTVAHFPRPIIEALCVGTLPVASILPGIDEIIIDQFNGILFENGSLLSLLNAINSITTEKHNRLVKNGYKTYLDKFSEKNEDRIIDVVKRVMN
jgi:glycosyltransferase involved in cell wall biosynthesis